MVGGCANSPQLLSDHERHQWVIRDIHVLLLKFVTNNAPNCLSVLINGSMNCSEVSPSFLHPMVITIALSELREKLFDVECWMVQRERGSGLLCGDEQGIGPSPASAIASNYCNHPPCHEAAPKFSPQYPVLRARISSRSPFSSRSSLLLPCDRPFAGGRTCAGTPFAW